MGLSFLISIDENSLKCNYCYLCLWAIRNEQERQNLLLEQCEGHDLQLMVFGLQ